MTDLDEAEAPIREGRYDDAVSEYLRALDSPLLPADDWLHVMSHLATAYRLAGRWDTAETVARGAIAAAKASGSLRTEAHAQLTLGTLLLAMLQEEIASRASEDVFVDATDALDRAATLYQELDLIDFYTCLFTLAEALRWVEENAGAEGIYARMTRELCDERWAEPPTMARHADHLRARAFMGLAQIAFAADDGEKARDRMEAAVGLLIASGNEDPVVPALLEAMSNEFRVRLKDARRADEILVLAKSL